MDLIKLFKKSTKKGSTQLDHALGAIRQIEKKRAAAREALEAAKKALETSYATSIADGSDEPATCDVLDAQSRLDAVEAVHKETWQEALTIVAASHGQNRERLAAIENELADLRRGIDTRRVQAIATFARENGCRVSWPSKVNGGTIHVQALTLGADEILQIADAVTAAEKPDQDAKKLDKLYHEKTMLNGLIRGNPEYGLQALVAQRA